MEFIREGDGSGEDELGDRNEAEKEATERNDAKRGANRPMYRLHVTSEES